MGGGGRTRGAVAGLAPLFVWCVQGCEEAAGDRSGAYFISVGKEWRAEDMSAYFTARRPQGVPLREKPLRRGMKRVIVQGVPKALGLGMKEAGFRRGRGGGRENLGAAFWLRPGSLAALWTDWETGGNGGNLLKEIIRFARREAVLSAAAFLAVISMAFIRPDREYAGYVDVRTLALLFCLMTVMVGLQGLGVFERAGRLLVKGASGRRQTAAVLVGLCFFSSMAVTNDVALITFVPFALTVLGMAGMEDMAVAVVVLQTLGANLGSMLTPVGNPQNLYLYSRAGMKAGELVGLMLPYCGLSLALLAACLFFVGRGPAGKLELEPAGERLRLGTAILYAVLFFLAVAAVAGIMPWQPVLAVTAGAVLAADRRVLKRVDYSLLATFCCFFVFIGNMGRIPAFRELLARLVEGREVLAAVAASQIISNVPAALLLSGFTGRWEALIVGTNLGGLGTLIASMASLISYKYIAARCPEKRGSYLLWFTAANLGFLACLLGLSWVMGRV